MLEIFRGDFLTISKKIPNLCLTIGNFDGCHLGHQKLLQKAKKLADQQGLTLGILTFDPHPSELLGRKKLFPLMSLDQKIAGFTHLGAEVIIVQEVKASFLEHSHGEFFQALVEKLSLKALVVGADFRFGKNRLGDIPWLKEICTSQNIPFLALEEQHLDGALIHSSLIRRFLEEGKIKQANALLGHPWLISSCIEEGQKLGQRELVPTLNIPLEPNQNPMKGVYFAKICIGSGHENPFGHAKEQFSAVVNIGQRPTVTKENSPVVLEAHILDEKFEGELYKMPIGVYLLEFLRQERKFSDLSELKAQISKDILAAKDWFKEN